MKTIILFFILSINLFSQSFLLWYDESSYANQETSVYLASLTTPISPAYAATLDGFITKVKDSLSITALSQKFDVMYDLGGYSAEQSLKNLVKRSHDATNVNSAGWVQWQGFTGNGTSSYLNTNYNPSSQGVVVSTSSVSMGAYSRTDFRSSLTILGSYDGSTFFELVANASFFYVRVLKGDVTTVLPSSAGFIIGNRISPSIVQGYYNGLQVGSNIASNTAAFPDFNVYLDARNASGTANSFHVLQESFAFIGTGLTPTEVSRLTNCVEWLMDRKGTGVIP